jgi:hypothetical protein
VAGPRLTFHLHINRKEPDMIDTLSFAWLHDAVRWLLAPALAALLIGCAIALLEAGIAAGACACTPASTRASTTATRIRAPAWSTWST